VRDGDGVEVMERARRDERREVGAVRKAEEDVGTGAEPFARIASTANPLLVPSFATRVCRVISSSSVFGE
jgi:hypothetical protein